MMKSQDKGPSSDLRILWITWNIIMLEVFVFINYPNQKEEGQGGKPMLALRGTSNICTGTITRTGFQEK